MGLDMIVAVSGKKKGEGSPAYIGTQVLRHIGRKNEPKQIQHNAEPLPPGASILPIVFLSDSEGQTTSLRTSP
jgi:hypothetical protein